MRDRGGLYELNDVEGTLGRIVIGYRIIAAAWAVVLVLVAVTGDQALDRPWVPWLEIGTILAWLMATVWLHGRRPASLRTWWFLGVDTLLAVAVLLASVAAGEPDVAMAGGYPLSALAVAVYGHGGVGGVASGSALLAATLVRRFGFGEPGFAGIVSDLAAWVFPVVVFSWAIGVIRLSDVRRRRSEEALAAERAERARVEERADVAAHLHDSVLQTLALIQRHAADAEEVTTLARGQERDLRSWLYGAGSAPLGATLQTALRAVADSIEADTRVPVEVVAVGDLEMDDRTEALVMAAREAVSNAARHSGAAAVDVYSEVDTEAISVFVRDRGSGFDLSAVPSDRAGVRESIIGRVSRLGGTAEVRSSTRGTDVRMIIPRDGAGS